MKFQDNHYLCDANNLFSRKAEVILSRFFLLLMMFFLIVQPVKAAETEIHKFTILHTNDSHSALRPHPAALDYNPQEQDPTLGGIARLANLIKKEREKRKALNEDVFVISAGDFHGGDPYAWLGLKGQTPELNLLQKIGYDLVTIGNHEYDYGPIHLADYLKNEGYPEAAADLPVLAANTIIPEEHPLAEMGIEDCIIKKTTSGLKIGFFGLIGDDAVSVAHEIEPLEFASPQDTASNMVAILEEKGADVTIAISHAGLTEDRELAREVKGIDVIIGGHSHHALQEKEVVNDTIIVQAGSRLNHLGVLELAYQPVDDKLQVLNEKSGQSYLTKIDDSIEEDSAIADRVQEYTEALDHYLVQLTDGRYASFMEPAFELKFSVPARPEMRETQFGNLLTDAMRFGVEDLTGKPVDFAFEANGLIRRGLIPATTPQGKNRVSFYQLAAAAGLGTGPDHKPGYPLVEIYLTGNEVKNILEISTLLSELRGDKYFLQTSGAKYTYDRRRTVLFNIPIIDKPLPSGRAVLKADRYTGSGIQANDSEGYQPLPGDEKRLYRVVTDYYLVQFLPLVGEVVPSLKLELKKEDGSLLVDREEAIISHNGREVKVWQALFHYAKMQNGQLSSAYREKGDRIVSVEKFSVLATPSIIIIPLLLLIAYLIYRLVIFIKTHRQEKRKN